MVESIRVQKPGSPQRLRPLELGCSHDHTVWTDTRGLGEDYYTDHESWLAKCFRKKRLSVSRTIHQDLTKPASQTIEPVPLLESAITSFSSIYTIASDAKITKYCS